MNKAFTRQLRDAALLVTKALPASASSTVTTDPIDTGVRTARGIQPDGLEVVLTIPALSTTIAPDTRTVTLIIESSDASNFGSYETLRTVVVTGAGGVGVPTPTELRVTVPLDGKRYFRGKITFGASTTDGSALSAELALVGGPLC